MTVPVPGPARFCADGTAGDAFLVAPPLTATDEELGELLARLRATLASLRRLFEEKTADSERTAGPLTSGRGA